MGFTKDGSKLAVCSLRGQITLWDTATCQVSATWDSVQSPATVSSFAVMPGGNEAVYTIDNRNSTIVSLVDGRPIRTIYHKVSSISNMVVTPDAKRIAVGLNTGEVIIWNIKLGVIERKIEQTISPDSSYKVEALAFDADSSILAVSYSFFKLLPFGTSKAISRSICLYNIESGMALRTLTNNSNNYCNALAFIPNRTHIVSGDSDGEYIVWDYNTGNCVQKKRPLIELEPLSNHLTQLGARSLACSPDGAMIAIGTDIGIIALWDLAQNTITPIPSSLSPHYYTRALGFSADGRKLRSVDAGGNVSLVDVEKKQVEKSYCVGGRNWVAAAFNLDLTKLLSVNSIESIVECWDVDKASLHATIPVQDNKLVCAAFLPDNRSFITAAEDGTLRLWNFQQTGATVSCHECLAMIALEKGNAWLCATPEGFYDVSLEAPRYVSWHIGDLIYPLDQFEQRYYRPDIIAQTLAGRPSYNIPVRPLKPPPSISFTSPEYGSMVTGDSVSCTLKVSGSTPITRIEITINGQPLPPENIRELTDHLPVENDSLVTLTIPLPPNEPRIRLRAIAYDTDLFSSLPDEVALFRPDTQSDMGMLYLLSIGIDTYVNKEVPDLRYAAKDAKAVANAFSSLRSHSPYTDIHTTILMDEDATISNIKAVSRSLQDSAGENDVVMIYFAGHGLRDRRGTLYLGTYDMELDRLPLTAWNAQDLTRALTEVRAKRIILLLDTCYAGSAFGDNSMISEQLARKINRESHRIVFVSSRRDEVSIGNDKWGHGAFTKALLEALAGTADTNEDGLITLRELRDYVEVRVINLTDGKQHPQLPFIDDFDPDSILASTN